MVWADRNVSGLVYMPTTNPVICRKSTDINVTTQIDVLTEEKTRKQKNVRLVFFFVILT